MGYPLEKHVYTTADGYINTVYRIAGPAGTKPGQQKRDPNRPVVIYQHGLLDCCVSIVADEEDSIGLQLVDKGFDLWLNNARGNRYSRDHQYIDLDTCSPEEFQHYFSFSFDQMAEYDQPALWKYIVAHTGAEAITYIGHSQGCTQLFAQLCENGGFYRKHLKRLVALAPVVSIKNSGAQVLRDLFEDNEANVEWCKGFGPEVLTKAPNDNILANFIFKSMIGEKTSSMMI